MLIEKNKDYKFDPDQFLWRYIDLHRLIYFLNSENIYFSPLNSFFDPLEGITQKHLQEVRWITEPNQETTGETDNLAISDQPEDEKDAIKENFKNKLQEIQKFYFASCWYLGVRESLAMWEAYSNKDSVALRFSPSELCENMLAAAEKVEGEDFDLLIHGKVEYFKISPFDADDSDLENAGHRFKGFLKDLSYKHEEEFRFLAVQKNKSKTNSFFELAIENLDKLDFKVVTHPNMEPWKYNNIHNILKAKGLEDKLMKSAIPTRRQVFDTP